MHKVSKEDEDNSNQFPRARRSNNDDRQAPNKEFNRILQNAKGRFLLCLLSGKAIARRIQAKDRRQDRREFPIQYRTTSNVHRRNDQNTRYTYVQEQLYNVNCQ